MSYVIAAYLMRDEMLTFHSLLTNVDGVRYCRMSRIKAVPAFSLRALMPGRMVASSSAVKCDIYMHDFLGDCRRHFVNVRRVRAWRPYRHFKRSTKKHAERRKRR